MPEDKSYLAMELCVRFLFRDLRGDVFKDIET